MQLFNFSRKKYGVEFLMDLGTYNDIPNYYFKNDLHCTDFFEIIFFSNGNGYLELDNQRIEIQANTVLFISPYQKRKWFVNKHEIDCYFLLFQEGFLSDFFSDKLFIFKLQYFYNKRHPLAIQIEKKLLEQLHSLFNELKSEFKCIKSDSKHLVRSILYFVLIKLNRLYAVQYHISEETETNQLAYLFKQLLVNNIQLHRDINFYAQKLGVSRVTLNKYIKLQFGVTVSEMIDEYFLFEIKSLLLYSQFSIKEIADKFAFSEPNHLSRFFKNYTGLTPTEFISAYQKGRSII
ncbi:MAG: AraC family transcriptional regulator [Chitinophaga sp.]|jgi:AraC-like DNA-binding protein|nr:AraC family transcriptional regulator [Chitinophaga sp.]PJE48116.1 MAG: AraC family transcriptional regulator [Sediminibacterium sp.] [Sediminibacterium sp. FEMGT703S]